MRNRVNIAKKISRREDGANATNIAYGSETVEARFAESLKSWRNRKTKKAIYHYVRRKHDEQQTERSKV